MTDSEEASGSIRFEIPLKDRPSKIRRPGGGYRKVSKIICLNAAFVCLGLCTAYVGPCILDLQLQTGATIGEVSRVFVGRAAGTMAGSTVGLLMTDSIAGWHASTTLALSSLAVGIAVVPWCHNLPMLVGAFLLQGSATGLISSRCSGVCQQLWGRTGSNQLYVVHLSYGIGALAAPLLVERFIVDRSIAMPSFHNSQPAVIDHRRARRDSAGFPSADALDDEALSVAPNATSTSTKTASPTNVLPTTETADEINLEHDLVPDFNITQNDTGNADVLVPDVPAELENNVTTVASTAAGNTTGGLTSQPGPSLSSSSSSSSSSSTTAMKTARHQKPGVASGEHLNQDKKVADGSKFRDEIRDNLNKNPKNEDDDAVEAKPTELSPSSTNVWNNMTSGITPAGNDTIVDVSFSSGNSTVKIVEASNVSFSANGSASSLESFPKNISSPGKVANNSDVTQHSDSSEVDDTSDLVTESGTVDHTDVEEYIADVKSSSTTPGPPSLPLLGSPSSSQTPGPPSLSPSGSPSTTPTPAAVPGTSEPALQALSAVSASSTTKTRPADAGTSKSTQTYERNPVHKPTTITPAVSSTQNATKIADDGDHIETSSSAPSTSTSTVTSSTLKLKTATSSSSTKTTPNVVSSTPGTKPYKLDASSTTTVATATAAVPPTSLPSNKSPVHLDNVSKPSPDQMPQLSAAYWIIAVFVSLAAAMFAILWCTSPECCRQRSRYNGAADRHHNDPTVLTAAAFSTIVVLHFFHVGSESAFSGLLSYFAGSLLGWTASASVLLLVGFWTAFAAGRLACVVVASRLRPWPLMFSGFAVGLIAVIGIVLGVIERSDAAIFARFHSRSAAIWTGSVLLGLGCSLILPAGIKFFTPGRRTTIAVTVGSSVGDILVPVIAGFLTDVYDANWIVYTVFASAAGGLTICTVLRCVVPPPSVTCRHVRLLNPAADDLEGTMTDTNGEEEAELLGTECSPAEISVSESMTAILPSPSLRRSAAKSD